MRDPVRIISFILAVALLFDGLFWLPLYLFLAGMSHGVPVVQLLGWGIAVVVLPLASGIFLLVEAVRAKPGLGRVVSIYLGVLTLVEAASFIIVFDHYSERPIVGLYALGICSLIGLILISLVAFLLLSPAWLYRRYPNLVAYLGIAFASAGAFGLIISSRSILWGGAWRMEARSDRDLYYGLVVAAVVLLAFLDAAIIFATVRRNRTERRSV
jgi:hypothetical protein